jgi:predicted outer membrane repeat protein
LSMVTFSLNSAAFGGALYMWQSAVTTVQLGGSLCISGNKAQTTGGGVYMKNGAILDLKADNAAQVMGGNTPNALVVLESARFTCASDGFPRGIGNATERIFTVNGGPICSCPQPPAPSGPLDAQGTTFCTSCPTGQQWHVDQCSCA